MILSLPAFLLLRRCLNSLWFEQCMVRGSRPRLKSPPPCVVLLDEKVRRGRFPVLDAKIGLQKIIYKVNDFTEGPYPIYFYS